MFNDLLQWARDLNQYDTAIATIGIFAPLIIAGVVFVLRRFFHKMVKSPTDVSDKGNGHHKPDFSLSKRVQHGGMYRQLEIRNTGNEPLEGINITRRDGIRCRDFLNINEQQMNAHPHYCETLDVDERKVIINFPTNVHVSVSATGAKSHKLLRGEFDFDFSDFRR